MADQRRRGARGQDGRGQGARGQGVPQRRPRAAGGSGRRTAPRADRQDSQDSSDASPQNRAGAQRKPYDGPPLPEDITGRELDKGVRQQLRSLPDRLAARVARHLVAAGRLLDSDPETAYQHTLAARGRATRLAVVREACGEAAYLAGHYPEALTELRAARRMNGAADYLPVMADCERALGKPERALAIAKEPAVERLDPKGRVEMLIVASGARLDMGQPEMAARMLEGKDLRSRVHAPWVARIRYAYAEALLAGGRSADAVEWFHRAAAADSEEVTDAAQRLAELEGMEVLDVVDLDGSEGTSGEPRGG